jgi:hypothetical protein
MGGDIQRLTVTSSIMADFIHYLVPLSGPRPLIIWTIGEQAPMYIETSALNDLKFNLDAS